MSFNSSIESYPSIIDSNINEHKIPITLDIKEINLILSILNVICMECDIDTCIQVTRLMEKFNLSIKPIL
jgi:hypothetical protein